MRSAIIARLGRSFEITGSPPVGNVGDPYLYTFGTTGGFGSNTWTCTSLGASGAAFSAGTLSSLALLASGPFPFTLTAIDEARQIAVASFVLLVLGSTVNLMICESSGPVMCTEGGVDMRV